MKTYNFQGRKLSKEDFIKEVLKLYAKADLYINKTNGVVKISRASYPLKKPTSYENNLLRNYQHIVSDPKYYYKEIKARKQEADAKSALHERFAQTSFARHKDELLLELVRNGKTTSNSFKEIYLAKNDSELNKIKKSMEAQ